MLLLTGVQCVLTSFICIIIIAVGEGGDRDEAQEVGRTFTAAKIMLFSWPTLLGLSTAPRLKEKYGTCPGRSSWEFLFLNGSQVRNCLHSEDMKTSTEHEPRLPNQSRAGGGLEGVLPGTEMGYLASWPGTEAVDRGYLHREDDGLCKSQRMFALHGLLPSTCPSSGSLPLEGILASPGLLTGCEMSGAQVAHFLAA